MVHGYCAIRPVFFSSRAAGSSGARGELARGVAAECQVAGWAFEAGQQPALPGGSGWLFGRGRLRGVLDEVGADLCGKALPGGREGEQEAVAPVGAPVGVRAMQQPVVGR